MWELWPSLSLKEVTNENDGIKYFIFLNKHDESDDYIKLTLLDGLSSYHVEMTEDEYKAMAEQARLSLSEFTVLTISALTCETLSTDSFAYTVNKSESSIELAWKKVLPEQTMKLKLGSLDFRTVDNANEVCNMLQQLSKYISRKSQEIKLLQNEKSDLQATNKQLRNILETEIVSKDELEKELYSKFVIVLNNKKAKCRQYKAQLSKAGRRQQIDTDETSEDQDVEEEEARPAAQKKRDTSLLFEDSSEDSQPAQTQRVVKQKRTVAATRPRREQEKQKQKTNVRSSAPTYEADTQELMDDL